MFTGTLTVIAADGRTSTAAITADVSSVVGSGATFSAVQGQPFSGTVATFHDVNGGTTAGQYTAEIYWGDGNTSSGTITADGDGGFVVTGANTFAVAGTLNPQIVITDPSGGSAVLNATADVAGLVATSQTVTATAGQSFTGTIATFTDTGPNASNTTYTATVDWGDGTPVPATVTPDANGDGGYTVTGTYTFAEPGTFDPTVTVTASDGRTGMIQSEADVADPPMTVTAEAITATQNQPFTGTVATFTNGDADATTADFTATVDWGDGNDSDGTVTAQPDGSFTVSGNNTYLDTGAFTVTVTIYDTIGTPTGATSTATVAADPNAPLTDTVPEGSPYDLNLPVALPGLSNVDHWQIDWGDGTPANPDKETDPGTTTDAPHTFAAGVSAAIINVSAYDGSGNVLASKTIELSVLPAAPQNVSAVWNSDNSVTLSWADASSITGSFTILSSADGGETFSAIGNEPAGADAFTTTVMDPTQNYMFEVAGDSGSGGTGVSSDASSAAPLLASSLSGTAGTSGGSATTGTTPTLSITPGPDPATSATATWTDNFSGDSSAELELMDEETGENFHLYTNPQTIPFAGGTASYNLTGLATGDVYDFRLRVDHSDGTVSDYSAVQYYTPWVATSGVPTLTASVYNIPANDPTFPPFDTDNSNEPRLDWTTINPGDYVEIYVRGDAYPNWKMYSSGNGDGGWPTTSPDSSQGELLGDAYVGPGKYEYRIFDDGVYSKPVVITIPHNDGSTGGGPALTPSVGGDSVTVTWQPPPLLANGYISVEFNIDDGPNNYAPDVWLKDHDQWDENSINGPSGPPQYTFGNLTPGRHVVTMRTEVGWQTAPDPQDTHDRVYFSHVTINIGGNQQRPAAPHHTFVNVQFAQAPDADFTQNTVRLAWTNDSNNETGFQVDRSNDRGKTWTLVKDTAADNTVILDRGSLNPGDYLYRITPFNGSHSAEDDIEHGDYIVADVGIWPPGLLVAFDGSGDTWSDQDTITRFVEQYHGGFKQYIEGVSDVAFATDMARRVLAGWQAVSSLYESHPDDLQSVPLDIVGYSRGCFEALALARLIQEKGLINEPSMKPSIRYLGMISAVGQTWLVGELLSIVTLGQITWNPGYPDAVPSNVYFAWEALDYDPLDGILPQQKIPGAETQQFMYTHHWVGYKPDVRMDMFNIANAINVPIPLITLSQSMSMGA